MKFKVHKSLSIMLIILISTFSLQYDSFGQRKGNKKKKVNNKPLTEEEIFQAEFYFIEAEKFYLIEDFAKSLDMFNRSLEINSKNAAANYKIAEIYVQDEKFEDALPFAIKAKELDPDNKYYYILNAKLSLQQGDYTSAAKNYEELFDRFEGNEDYLFDLANIYEYTDEPKKSISIYNRIEHVYGKYIEITKQKERIFLKLKDEESARGEWINLLEFSPSPENYLAYIDFLEKNNLENEVNGVIEEAIITNPSSNELLLRSSKMAFNDGKFDKSLKLLEKPIKDKNLSVETKVKTLLEYLPKLQNENKVQNVLDMMAVLSEVHESNFQVLALTGDLYYQLGKAEEAFQYYEQAVKEDEGKFEVWQNIIVIETELGNFDKVISQCERAKEIYPNQALLYFYGGAAHLMKKNYKESIYEMEKGVRYARRDKNLLNALYGQLGDAYNGLGNFEESDKSFEKALEIDENNTYALNNYSYYLSLRGENLGKALEMSKVLTERNPENTSYLDTHGWALYKSGKYKESKKVFEKAISLEGVDGIIFEHYGDVLFKLGRKDEAVSQWQKAKNVGMASDLIDKKIADRKLYE